mmetsp:Transcript_14291/g.30942  ORF Transcript_14291/g.30942 Transcript_14291/m.30942 type:complete len:282 (-) Transcript_14291:36-881(-)
MRPLLGLPPPPDMVPDSAISCPCTVTTLRNLLSAPYAMRDACSRSLATRVLFMAKKKAVRNRSSLYLTRSNRRGTPSGVWRRSAAAPARCFCFSRMRKVATPRLLRRRYSTQRCASLAVSTTMKSRAPTAVETATSYLASTAPKSPSRPYTPDTSPLVLAAMRAATTPPCCCCEVTSRRREAARSRASCTTASSRDSSARWACSSCLCCSICCLQRCVVNSSSSICCFLASALCLAPVRPLSAASRRRLASSAFLDSMSRSAAATLTRVEHSPIVFSQGAS